MQGEMKVNNPSRKISTYGKLCNLTVPFSRPADISDIAVSMVSNFDHLDNTIITPIIERYADLGSAVSPKSIYKLFQALDLMLY